jgi:hypothetical protein
MQTKELAHLGPRAIKPLALAAAQIDAALINDLPMLGIGMDERTIMRMASGMDSVEPTVTTGTIPTPIQFLQQWLPGFVNIITQARKIDALVGMTTVGAWEDEEVVQGTMELTGSSVPYGDFNNIPYSSWNVTYQRRSVVRFEEGMFVGRLEEARSARADVNSGDKKRAAAALALEIQRNRIGFYGYNSGANRTYGFLNDPALPAYVNFPTGNWATATFLQITADLRGMFSSLRTQSGDTIDPKAAQTTLAIASEKVDYLSTVSDFGVSVSQWLRENYPTCRVESAPELNNANGGADVVYLYAESVDGDGSTDDGRVFVQIVPTKFRVLGVDQRAKGYEEDYTNATAGIMLKRPYAVVRRSGA